MVPAVVPENGFDAECLFPNLTRPGGLIDHDGAVKRFNRVLKGAGLPHFRVYDTSHTFARLLLEKNAPIGYVAKMLGHSKPETTLRFYTDWLPKEDPG